MLTVKLSGWLEAGYCQLTLTVMAAYIKHNKYNSMLFMAWVVDIREQIVPNVLSTAFSVN